MTAGRIPDPSTAEAFDDELEVVMVGAGPQGLAVALHLVAADPSLRSRMAVIDPAGEWITAWESAFARLDIDTLRSPGVHHPGLDPDGLRHFGLQHRLPPGQGAYALPRTTTFAAYCRHLVVENGLDGMVRASRAHQLSVDRAGAVVDTDRQRLRARHVVIATNPHRRVLPPWLAALVPLGRHQLAHADDVDLRGLQLDGERVVVVGGGLSAAHLAVGAARRGARVHLVARRPLAVRPFDVDAGWLGPRHLDAYRREPHWGRRLAVARRARGGGSLPRWMVRELEGSGVVVHAPALLELGPAAGNLWGARQAGRRIARSLTGMDPGEDVSAAGGLSRRRRP